jgi:hypothetical protein
VMAGKKTASQKKPKMAKCPECGMMHPGGKHPKGMMGKK